MKNTTRKSLLLSLVLASSLCACKPDFDLGGNGNDTKEPADTQGLDTFPDITGACKGASQPGCKTEGVCNEQSSSGLPLVWSCNEETLKWECDYSVLGDVYQKKETHCDGKDNDCDGDKDEIDDVDFADACPAMNNGVCSTAPGAVTITCVGAGNPPVHAFECDATEVPDYSPRELFDPQIENPGSLCDNTDNDCDGDTDEDHEHYGDLDQTDIEGLSYSLCQGFGGICHASVANEDPYQAKSDVYFRCYQGSMECNYKDVALFDAPESLCDSIDNDCDGETDEVTDITESDCPYQGVCDGKVDAVCLGGHWICDMTQILADLAYQVEETLCDGLDNDCDGDIDEGLDWESLVAARCGEACDTPFCKTWSSGCVGSKDPGFAKGDNCPMIHGDTELIGQPSVPDLDPYGKPVLPGVCGYDPITEETDVLLHCLPHDGNNDGTYEAAYFVCAYDALEFDGVDSEDDELDIEANHVYAENEALFHADGHWCDNLDNDCDGLVDQHKVYNNVLDIEITESSPYQDLAWTTCHVLGECATNTTAKCKAGAWICTYMDGPVETGDGDNCGTDDSPEYDDPACQWVETKCDGLDNDCDGEVDEAITATDGDALTAAGCTQEGVCAGAVQAVCNDKGEAPGIWSCDYSAAFALGYAQLEDGDPELCDALDNDCDGLIDEEISAGPLDANYAAIIDEAGCLYLGICDDTVTAACNEEDVGTPGVWECKYPAGFTDFTVLLQGIYHENKCDGLDNDCDGVADEGLDSDFGGEDESPKKMSNCSFEGICADSMVWGCAQGESTCEGDPGVGWEAEETTCDNIDNDCDKVVDEDLTEPGPTGADCIGYGKGVCQIGLAANCSAGEWTCLYDGVNDYEEAEVSCDGVDNDCNGDTDDDLEWTTSPGNNACKSAGVCDPQDVVAICTGTAGGWLCNYEAIATYEGFESSCDGLDNDCDGDVDEQVCGACSPCVESNNCFNTYCRLDPFEGKQFCASGFSTCVMESLITGDCKSVLQGQTACVTPTIRGICMSEGEWEIDGVDDCDGDTPMCHEGQCKFCVPGALSCQGTVVYQCDALGAVAYSISTCPPGQICVGAGDCISNGEFQVDVLAADALSFDPKPRVAGLKGGGFVVVWGSASETADGSGTAVMARIYGADLAPAGDPLLVNEILEDDQGEPAVDAATVGFGRFVVAWATTDTAGDPGQGIVARVFEADGTPVSGEFRVNQVIDMDQSNPSVTMYEDGRFLVTWVTKLPDPDDNNSFDVKARYFEADGTPDGDEFTLNTFTPNTQRTSDVDFLPDGGLAGVWASLGKDDYGFAVLALTLDASGGVVLEDKLVNEWTFGSQKNPAVVALEEGDQAGWFAVVWESTSQESGDSSGVFLRLLNEFGLGLEIQVHQNDYLGQRVPRITRLPGDRLVIVWESDDADGNGAGIARRIFNSSGVPETNELPVNQSISGDQLDPDVSGIDPTTFVVVWTNSHTGHVMGRILND